MTRYLTKNQFVEIFGGLGVKIDRDDDSNSVHGLSSKRVASSSSMSRVSSRATLSSTASLSSMSSSTSPDKFQDEDHGKIDEYIEEYIERLKQQKNSSICSEDKKGKLTIASGPSGSSVSTTLKAAKKLGLIDKGEVFTLNSEVASGHETPLGEKTSIDAIEKVQERAINKEIFEWFYKNNPDGKGDDVFYKHPEKVGGEELLKQFHERQEYAVNRLIDRALDEDVLSQVSIVIDDHCSSPNMIADLAKIATDNGMESQYIGVAKSPENCLQDAKKREREQNLYTHLGFQRETHHLFGGNLSKAVESFDSVIVMDNNTKIDGDIKPEIIGIYKDDKFLTVNPEKMKEALELGLADIAYLKGMKTGDDLSGLLGKFVETKDVADKTFEPLLKDNDIGVPKKDIEQQNQDALLLFEKKSVYVEPFLQEEVEQYSGQVNELVRSQLNGLNRLLFRTDEESFSRSNSPASQRLAQTWGERTSGSCVQREGAR